MAIDQIVSASIADDAVTNAKVSYNNNSFRNIIINGDMSVAQRATSTASITGNGYKTMDRFHLNCDTMGTWTQSQSTEVPTGQGFAYSMKMDCTTADASPAAGDQLKIQIKNEGQFLQYLKKGTSSAESLTLSFWVRSNKTGTYITRLQDSDNSRNISKSYTISSADTWEKKEITFAGDTSGAFTNDANNSLVVEFYLGAGSNFTSGTLNTSWNSITNANTAVGQVNLADSTSNEWYITGIQLEAGTSASDFEFLPYDRNFSRCQRYYIKLNSEIYGNNNYAGTNTSLQNYYMFRELMRAGPTITVGTAHGWTSGPTAASATSDGFRIYGAGGNVYIDPPGYIADAEL